MNINEAYGIAMAVVKRLEAFGIRVVLKEPLSRKNREIVAKYSRRDRLKSELWFHITFFPTTVDEQRMIHDQAVILREKGIAFDTGGMQGQRDWEFDWSFRLSQPDDGLAVRTMEDAEDSLEENHLGDAGTEEALS